MTNKSILHSIIEREARQALNTSINQKGKFCFDFGNVVEIGRDKMGISYVVVISEIGRPGDWEVCGYMDEHGFNHLSGYRLGSQGIFDKFTA